MPISDPQDGFFYPTLTLVIDSYNTHRITKNIFLFTVIFFIRIGQFLVMWLLPLFMPQIPEIKLLTCICFNMEQHIFFTFRYMSIQDICHFTSSQGYGTLSFLLPGTWDTVINIFLYFRGYRIFWKINYGDICQFIRDMPVNYKGICNPPIQATPMRKSLL